MRTAAIIITGLSLAMALDGEYKGLPFYLAIALALELRHRARAGQPRTADPEAPTNRIPVVGPRRKRGRHG